MVRKRWEVLVLALMMTGLAVMPLYLGGCAGQQRASPMLQVVQAGELYTGTLRALTAARQAGLIDDARAVQIEKVRAVAARALDAAEEAALKSDASAFSTAYAAFTSAIETLLRERLLVQKGSRGPRRSRFGRTTPGGRWPSRNGKPACPRPSSLAREKDRLKTGGAAC
jgi:hypothetical protein